MKLKYLWHEFQQLLRVHIDYGVNCYLLKKKPDQIGYDESWPKERLDMMKILGACIDIEHLLESEWLIKKKNMKKEIESDPKWNWLQ